MLDIVGKNTYIKTTTQRINTMSQFIKLYNNQPFTKNLSIMESVILSYIIDLSHKEKYCYANNKALADKVGCSEITIKNTIRKLKQEKIIHTTFPNQGRRIYLNGQYKDLLVSEKEAKKNENMKRGKQISSKLKAQKARIKILEDTVAKQSREIAQLKERLTVLENQQN